VKKKILVIDDDPHMIMAVEAVFRNEPYNVITASNGEEGLQKIVTQNPDLIILDVVMPVKNGFQVCKELKTEVKFKPFSKIPILMLTVYPDDREKLLLSMQEGMMMEAEDYIQKPFDPDELLGRVAKLLKVAASIS
jgi:two-component system alkaline phosphatase synthesis response regulator PhoP